jgi:mycoredoxin
MRLGYPAELTNSIVERLNKLKITFTEVDIERSTEAAAVVESLNNGNQMVPTLVFSDGTSMTNPSAIAVKEKLGAL